MSGSYMQFVFMTDGSDITEDSGNRCKYGGGEKAYPDCEKFIGEKGEH